MNRQFLFLIGKDSFLILKDKLRILTDEELILKCLGFIVQFMASSASLRSSPLRASSLDLRIKASYWGGRNGSAKAED